MPRLKVRDRQSGRVDTIDWNEDRPPTRDEIRRLVDQQRGRRYVRPGSQTPDNVSAPMVTPNMGRSSMFNRTTSSVFGDRGSQGGLNDLVTGEIREGPSAGTKLLDTLWGGEHSVLPPIRGITRPIAPESKNVQVDQSTGETYLGGVKISPETAPEAIAAQKLWNDWIRPSTSAIGLVSDRAAGKVIGGVGRHVLSPLWRGAKGLFGPTARVADEILPPVVAPTGPRPRLALPERAESAGPRFLASEAGPAVDVTRPLSTVAEKSRWGGVDPRKVTRRSGIVDPNTGRVKPTRGESGEFVQSPDESTLPVTVRDAELPNVDLSPEIVAAYSGSARRARGVPADLPPKGLTRKQRADWLRANRPRGIHKGAGEVTPAQRNPPTTEYVGQPDVRPYRPGRAQLFASTKRTASEREVHRLNETIRTGNRAEKKVAKDQLKRIKAEGRMPTTETSNGPLRKVADALKQDPSVIPPSRRAGIQDIINPNPSRQTSELVRDLENELGRTLNKTEIRALKRATNQSGFIDPTLARHVASASAGGVVGGLEGDTISERVQNALLGAAVGGAASVSFGGRKGKLPTVPAPGKPAITLHPPSLFTPAGRKRLKEESIDALNAPRAIMASVDLSAPLRQGATMIHKKEFWKALPDMVKSMGSEEYFHVLQDSIKASPKFDRMKKAKVALTDLNNMGQREELYMSKIAEKIPGLGRVIRASGRGYVGFLNKLRSDSFDALTEAAKKSGAKTSDREIAKYINAATGRGDLGKLERYAPALNAALFSPRLMASRVKMLNPVTYVKADPFVRKEYLKSMAAFGTAATTVLGLASAAGAEVEMDPRSSDFAKIKIGKTRLDIGAGFQQYIRVGAQIITGEQKDLETGRVETLGEKFHSKTRLDKLQEFFEAKASPIASFMLTSLKGRTFTGDKPQYLPDLDNIGDVPSLLDETTKSEVTRRLTPMIAQDLWELYREDPDLMWMAVPATFGSSIQVHKTRSARRRYQ